MANNIKGEVALQHDGIDYKLLLDFNALAEFEHETGVDNALAALQDAKGLGAGRMRILFWTGLKQHHPEITKDEAGRILTANFDKLGEALASAFPTVAPAGDAVGNAPAAAARTRKPR